MTSRFAILGLLLAGLLAPVAIACSAPTVEGSDLDNAPPTRKRDTKKAKSSELDSEDPEEESQSQSQTAPKVTGDDAGTSEPDPEPAPTTTTTTPPPPPPPPVVKQPACGSSNPLACLDCCLDNNPGAVQFENAYDACINQCLDSECDDQCQQEHVTLCNGNAACKANHACMQANNCLAQNFCN